MMLISNQGTAVRTRVEEVGVQGRNTQGVRVIRTRDGEALVSVSRIAEDDVDEMAHDASAEGVDAESSQDVDQSSAPNTESSDDNVASAPGDAAEGDEDAGE